MSDKLSFIFFKKSNLCNPVGFSQVFPGGSVVKHPPAMQETRVWSLGWEYPLEREVATHSSILAWEIPWTEEHGSYSSWGLKSWT